MLDISEIFIGLFFSFLPLLIIVGIIVGIVKLTNKNSQSSQAHKPQVSPLRSIIITLVILAAVPAGFIATFNFPNIVLGLGPNESFGIRITIGTIMLVAGLLLKHKIQRYFLLFLGLAIILVQAPDVFENYGSLGGLIAVGIAFLALVGGTIWLTMRPHHE